MVSILCCSTASNVAAAEGDDGSDDDEVEASKNKKRAHLTWTFGGETEDSQLSAGTSSRLTTPPP